MSFKVVEKFEIEIAKYFGSKYAVAVDCCTHALELCLIYTNANNITIPAHTYISVPFMAKKLGLTWEWTNLEWQKYYQIGNTNIIDGATFFEQDGYVKDSLMCISFQFKKHLSLGRGGVILTDDKITAHKLALMSYDGRVNDVPWAEQNIDTMGYHYYMTPETAQLGLEKLIIAKTKIPRVWSYKDYPNLTKMEVFNGK